MKAILWLLLLCPTVALGAEKIPGLGTANFPTSTKSGAAQHEFMRGLLLLHLFEYADAANAFAAAEKLDPGFAMAYWGEAMTFNHPVWNQLDTKAGQAALAKFGATPEARAARIADPRERAYMGAVEILYTDSGTKPERDGRYAVAMEQMSKTYPKDDEVQLFYSLALLGRSEGVRDVPTYLKAAAIAKAAFERNPDHPGAAHYWIHGMDDPQHAAGALEAARALSKIAPDAGHAQHMCSHIFMALGMWDDVVDANVNAMRVVDEQARAAGRPLIDCGHYDEWLQYGYYQQGRMKDGDRTLMECKHTGEAAAAQKQTTARRSNASLIGMRATTLVETRDWSGAAATMKIDMTGLDPGDKAYDAFAIGYAAAMRGDGALAASSLATVREMVEAVKKAPDADPEEVKDLGLLADELSSVVTSAGGDLQSAIAQSHEACTKYHSMAFAFGPPVTVKPPDELLGELLLQANNAPEARKAFEASLESAPRRSQSLLGLARAEREVGDAVEAQASYGELLKIWKSADPGYAPKAEAESYLATHSKSTRAESDSIAAAVLPLPEAMRNGAGVVRLDAALQPVVLRKSTNGMVCITGKPGDATFDVRCYHESFIPAVYRAFQLGYSVAGAKVGDEITAGKLKITNQPTAGYRCLGPSSGYDPVTNSMSAQIRCWQSIQLVCRTKPTCQKASRRRSLTSWPVGPIGRM
jgi:tetratricopeptide (TPR) repeat protein